MHLIVGLRNISQNLFEQSEQTSNLEEKEFLVRSGVSRIYYSCFHLMKAYAVAHARFRVTSSSKTSHDDLYTSYKLLNYRDLAQYGFKFKELRKSCEYDVNPRVNIDLDRSQALFYANKIHNHELFKHFLRKNEINL